MTETLSTHAHQQFLSYCNQKGFQRLYLEYYAYLFKLDETMINTLYLKGLRFNLKSAHFNPENTRYVQTELSGISKQMHEHIIQLRKAQDAQQTVEEKQLETSLQRAIDHEELDLESISELEDELLTHIKNNPGCLGVQFNLAWLYFHLLNDFETAGLHFINVADEGVICDHPLAEMALRYLALCKHFMGDNDEAIALLKRAVSLDQHDKQYYLYEMAQQMLPHGSKEAALGQMKAMIKSSPLYFLHIESDPFFMNIPETEELLQRFHDARLETIWEATRKKWLDSKFSRLELPAEFNKEKIFNETYDEHRQLLIHQPYPVLCKVEQISTKLMKNLTSKALSILNKINNQYTESMKREQHKWKLVNITGVALVYVAVLLTLASIFLFIGGDLVGITNAERSIDWGRLVPKIFAAVVLTGVAGIALLQFTPPRLKELARKKSAVTEVMLKPKNLG